MILSEKARELLDDIPPYLSQEPSVQRVYQAVANESDRAWAVALAIRVGLMPITANEDYHGLSMLESQLGLPVAPAGQSVAQRRATVLAWMRGRRGGRGADWFSLMSLALGGSPWSYFEGPGDFQLTIKVPYASGSFTSGQVLAFARAVTPAHIDILAAYDEGFLLGISLVGVEPL